MEFSRNNKLGSHLAPERFCWESFTKKKKLFLTNKQSVVIA
jgi:hypothetical protein